MSTAQLNSSFTFIGELDASVHPSSLHLSITANYNSLRYFVSGKTHDRILFFGSYTLHHISTDADLAECLQRIFEKDEVLQLKFGSVSYASDGPYQLAPSELAGLLSADTDLQSTYGGLSLIFSISAEITQAVKQQWPHAGFVQINAPFLKDNGTIYNDGIDRLFINVAAQQMDVIRYNRDRQLQLMNRYTYQDTKDFIYFAGLCCEDLGINREETELVLVGEVDIQSRIYDICYRYFRFVSFMAKPDHIHFAKAFDLFPKHLHYNLYNL